ncbi:MAG: HAMP domain-containing histidine kinase [Acidimicrobiia bacterium]|nr:HAMP domain-containing histidine kinase [Acidimicrobiia bacterium]
MRPRQEAMLDKLAEPMIRIIATLANTAWILVGAIALIMNDIQLAITAWPAVVIAVFTMVQLFTGRTDARATLVVCVAALAVSGVFLLDERSEAPTVIALAATGTSLSLYVRDRVLGFIAVYSALIVGVVLLGSGDATAGAITAITSAIVFGFTTYLIRQLLDYSARETERYGSLFYHSPVALWEEDFSGVELFLHGLRESGVEDLDEYLRAQPDAALRIAGLVEVTAANEEAVRLLEASTREEVLGQLSHRDVDSIDSLIDQLVAVWEHDDHIVTEIPSAKTLQGNQLHLALSWSAPLINGEPDYSHVSVAAVDVTESRETRRALEGLLRSKDELVATVSHELRTPLTTVVGLAAELRDSLEAFDEYELRELVALIASEGREVSTIVEDLLVAAQSETGKLHLNPERVDLVELASEVHRAMPKNGQLGLFVPDQKVWVRADPTRTRQIIRNLIVNADRYGGADVRICVVPGTGRAKLEVRDSGRPLPFREREAIFDRFYRARQVPGLTASVGLGLTVSRQLARDMKGDLTYSHDGEEAIFELSIPTYIAQPQDLAAARREAAG